MKKVSILLFLFLLALTPSAFGQGWGSFDPSYPTLLGVRTYTILAISGASAVSVGDDNAATLPTGTQCVIIQVSQTSGTSVYYAFGGPPTMTFVSGTTTFWIEAGNERPICSNYDLLNTLQFDVTSASYIKMQCWSGKSY